MLFGENQTDTVDMKNLEYGTPVYKIIKNVDGSQSIIVGSRISGGSDSARDNYVTAAVIMPDNASPEQMNEAIAVAYDNWKSNYSGVTTSDDITRNEATVLDNTNITTFNPFDFTAQTGGTDTRSLAGLIQRSLAGLIQRSLAGLIQRSLAGLIQRSLAGLIQRSLAGLIQRSLAGPTQPLAGLTRSLAVQSLGPTQSLAGLIQRSRPTTTRLSQHQPMALLR